MRIIKFCLLGILIGIFPLSSFASGIIYFGNGKNKQAGFIAKSGEDYYAYTSQSGLLSLGKFKIQHSGIKEIGPLEVSYESDIARIKVDPGEMKDKAYQIAGKVIMGKPVEILSIDLNAKTPANVVGMNRHSFALDKKTADYQIGTPVFIPKQGVVGVIGRGHQQFAIATHWDKNKVKIQTVPNRQAGRLDVLVKWVKADAIGFEKAAERVAIARKFQKGFLPLLNWWCKNPYRQLDESVKYPKLLTAWVKDHNHKTRAYDYNIKRCREDPVNRFGLVDSLMDANIQRGIVLSKFPQSTLRQMQINWKTPFLNFLTDRYARSWGKIDKMMEQRLKQMAYIMPHEFGQKKEYGGKKKSRKKKKYSKKGRSSKPASMPFAELSKSLVIFKDSQGRHALGAAVKIGEEGFIVTSQSLFMGNLKSFSLQTFSGKKLKRTGFGINRENDFIRIKVEEEPELIYLSAKLVNPPPKKTDNKSKKKKSKKKSKKSSVVSRFYTIGLYDGMIYQRKPDKGTLNSKGSGVPLGAPMFNSKKQFIGIASKKDDGFSGAAYKVVSIKADSNWSESQSGLFIKQVRLLQELRDFTKALHYTKDNFRRDGFMDIDTTTHRKLMIWITDQNKQAMAMKLVRIGKRIEREKAKKNGQDPPKNKTMADAMRQHKSRCIYYSHLKRLRGFHDSNVQRAKKTKWQSLYLKSQAEVLAKINQTSSDSIEDEMKQLVADHPATKTRL